MNEQLSLNLSAESEIKSAILDKLKAAALETLEKNWLPEEFLVSASKAQISSLYFLNQSNLIVRVKEKENRSFISVSEAVVALLPSNVKYNKDKNRRGNIEIAIEDGCVTSIHLLAVQASLQNILDTIACDFGCCGKYEECSDAKQCIHSDKQASLSCYYRRNLLQGRIFYGTNKNV